MTGCLDHETVAAYIDGALSVPSIADLEAHLDQCRDCRAHVSALAGVSTSRSFLSDGETLGLASTPSVLDANPGLRVGRMVVVEMLGRGGMGRVFEAYDPELDRRVALKLLDPVCWQRAGVDARARLQREAVVMARLAHPNVVTVFDVGVWADQLFVAMELVAGSTLDAWVREAAPRPRTVLEACIAAGRGLAAAHAAGIIHRDFKPTNILRGHDGRVRVSDFGLAALADEAEPDLVISGTPGYMSPEQIDGAAFDATSDQFSFCVTVWEMLAGERPFAGSSLGELRAAVAGKPAGGAAIPLAVRRVLLRGMATIPADRYRSMDALLAALTSAARRKRRVIAGLAATLAALAVGTGVFAMRSGPDPDVCGGASRRLVGVWDADRRAEVQRALFASGAVASFDRLAAVFDDRTRSWVETHTDACRATAGGAQSDRVLDARMQCLDDQLGELRALVEVIEQSGTSRLDRALEAANGLPQATACSAAAALSSGTPTRFTGIQGLRADELDHLVELAHARLAVYDVRGASQQLARAEGLLSTVPDPIREARVAYFRGRISLANHDLDQALDSLVRAAHVAAKAPDNRLVAMAAVSLVRLLAMTQRRAESTAWQATLELQLAHGGHDDLRAELEETQSLIAFDQRDYAAARDHAEHAVELTARASGRDSPKLIIPLAHLADATMQLEGHSAAEPHYRRALAITEAAYGPEHPYVAMILTGMASYGADASKADIARARATLERALAIHERNNPEDPALVITLCSLGLAALALDELPAAQAYSERAVAIAEKRGQGDAEMLLPSLLALGNVYAKQRRTDDARRTLTRAIDLIERSYGPTHPSLPNTLVQLAAVELGAGGCKAAAPLLDRASRFSDRGDGDVDVASTSYASLRLAECELAAGNASHALGLARRADEIRTRAKLSPALLAESRFAVAQALERTGKRAEAIAAAESAEREASREFADQIASWLRDARGGRRPPLVP
ncbi:MAG: hypothetical protein H6Q90_6147 [Deltaproteobacteria bacterium]|nr:hypothetical protein [Deltaproteobacteria bacterium]